MFFIIKVRVGAKIILIFVGSYKPTGRNNPSYCSAPKEFFDECRLEQHQEHGRQFDRAFANLKDCDEIIITKHRSHKVKFNNHDRVLAKRIMEAVPDNVEVKINILDLAKHIGVSFTKGNTKSKRLQENYSA